MAITSIDTKDQLIDIIVNKMGSNSSNVSEDGYGVAIDSALLELGWEIPCSHPKKIFWLINRSLRYSIEILLLESAHKFRYDKIFLQNRHTQYLATLNKMDQDFAKAVEDDPYLFASGTSVDTEYLVEALSAYIPNIRSFDIYGRE